jgi:Phage tail assembly chaperone proteins, E, or 41 or 14
MRDDTMEPPAPPEQPDELVVTLRKPVEFAGKIYDELRLREPTAGEMEEISKHSGTAGTIFAIAQVSGTPIGAVRRIGVRDMNKAGDYLLGFLEDRPSTGKTS